MSQPAIKQDSDVLWLNTLHGANSVEQGTVIFTTKTLKGMVYSLSWLDGHHSRNDDVPVEHILAVADSTGEYHHFPGWSGKCFLTDAGKAYIAGTTSKGKSTMETKQEEVKPPRTAGQSAYLGLQLAMTERKYFPFIQSIEDRDIVLTIIASHKSKIPITLKDLLARNFGSPATIERRLARLKKLGLVQSRRDRHDRRVFVLTQTTPLRRMSADWLQAQAKILQGELP